MTYQLATTAKTPVSFALRHSVGLIVGLACWTLAATADANLIQNPNFTFNGGGLIATDPDDVPNWTRPQNETGFFIASSPQPIFDFTHEYYQLQTGTGPFQATATQSLFQQVTVANSGTGILSMVASHRNDNVNFNGGVFIQLFAGHVGAGATGFGGLTPLTPDATVDPALSGALQIFSNTYLDLAPGDYTVRVGGFRNAGQLFQAGLSEVFFSVAIPEPSTGLLLSFGLFGLVMKRGRGLRV